jgi:ribosome-binding protein aMBF1 (putative translation factor)
MWDKIYPTKKVSHKKKGQGKMEFSEKLTPDELLSLYSDRIKKERQDEAVSLENTVRLESGGKLRTKIFEYGLG